MNNFFLYQQQGRPEFELIPWDKDYTFWRPFNDIFLRVDDSVLARRLLGADLRQAYLDGLVAAADAASEGEVSGDPSSGWLAAAISAPLRPGAGGRHRGRATSWTNAQFEDAVQGLRTFAARRSAFVRCSVTRNQSRTPLACR